MYSTASANTTANTWKTVKYTKQTEVSQAYQIECQMFKGCFLKWLLDINWFTIVNSRLVKQQHNFKGDFFCIEGVPKNDTESWEKNL